MRDRGVKFLYGRWLIEGGPKVLLFDTGSVWNRLDEWKGDLWNLAGIPSPPNDTETNETIMFGYLVAWFLGEVIRAALFMVKALADFSLYSSRLASAARPSSPTSTSGRPVSLSPSAASVTLT